MACVSPKSTSSRSNTRKSLYLWEFLFGLLEDEECSSVITWVKKREGIFALRNTEELAKLWGTVKNRPKMDKYKMFRAMRTYYNRGMLKKVKGHKGVYQFLSIPYETEGCDQQVDSFGQINASRGLPDTTDNKKEVVCGTTSEYLKSTENNLERITDNCEQMEHSLSESNGYRERTQSSASEYSFSSDCSAKSLEDQQIDLNDLFDKSDSYSSCLSHP
ncbi:ETS-related transcription factor Elf-1-like [Dendronephthya gigantea]|uniref:ETS-related transcription factor Elf-1-like n=1 Tax=Dendronephthya gigantea TaxID=151771 RepID=UPI00106DAD58|nr:ETS-related transcription factor Elf-1-like [Dendronephthya gigantea]